MKDLNQKISALKQTIRVLEEENIQLSERAEDTMLLGLVSESIQDLHDPIEIIDQVIERISILKNIPFITCARRILIQSTPLQLLLLFLTSSILVIH